MGILASLLLNSTLEGQGTLQFLGQGWASVGSSPSSGVPTSGEALNMLLTIWGMGGIGYGRAIRAPRIIACFRIP